MPVTNNAGGMYNDEQAKYAIHQDNKLNVMDASNKEHEEWVQKGLRNGWLK